MKSRLITVIPVFNGADFILQTLESLARQTCPPDRVIVIDNYSTDNTEQLVREFRSVRCEWYRNPSNLGLFGNCNRALDFADQADYLQILHADDLIEPKFYECLRSSLEDCRGLGLAYCLDERIDERNCRLSVSGKATGKIEAVAPNDFLRQKAEIANQAFCATLLKTNGQKPPCRFRTDMPILADMVFWPDWARHCQKIAKLHLPLAKYRWHGTNTTSEFVPNLQALVLDEWKTMQIVEGFRGASPSAIRGMKLKGLFAVRSGIKAKRFKERGNPAYSRQIVQAVRPITGLWLWLAAQGLVQLRDFVVYTLQRRPKHPKNVYS